MNGSGKGSGNKDLKDVLARLPSSKDADEVRITRLLENELTQKDWAKKYFEEAKKLQLDFFKSALQNKGDTHKNNQDLLRKLAEISNSRIVSGTENLNDLTAPAMIVTNHLGDYKLSSIKPEELGLKMGTDQIHPFPMYYSPYAPIAEKLDAQISAAHVKLPEPLDAIEEACDLVTIVIKEKGKTTEKLEEDTKSLFERKPKTVLVVFPEGGTTGKRNGGGPYDLEEFRAGAFVIAAHLGVPIIPAAKYFNPNSGYELGVLPYFKLENDQPYEYYKGKALNTQKDLQSWLDTKKSPQG